MYLKYQPHIRDLQYRSKIPPPHIEWRESQHTQLSVVYETVLHTHESVLFSSTIDRGLRTTSRQISFEFLFIKTCPPDKLHNGFGFVIQFRVGIRYLKCEGGEF
jgi:hypothetical protein